MTLLPTAKGRSTGHRFVAAAAALGALALVNHVAARSAERRHPPKGKFIDVDGVRLHYSDRGTGQPVVLIHGNVVTGDDYNISGVAQLLLGTHRVIIFDRPGFGHSERPRDHAWTAMQQAELLHRALRQIGVDRPVVVGHSWGTIVALSLATRYPDNIAGLVLISGYYFWTLRPDVLLAAPGAIPIVGHVLRYTVLPWLGRLMMPLLKRAMFSPASPTPRFQAEYSDAIALRPSQIRASSADGALMIPGALSLRGEYRRLSMPVVILAGEGDKVVFRRNAKRLHACIPGSNLQIVEGAGHMVHHHVPGRVAEAVKVVVQQISGSDARSQGAGMAGAEQVAPAT
jgi:pimeloyl-ACP methyl ester carboxylesterase